MAGTVGRGVFVRGRPSARQGSAAAWAWAVDAVAASASSGSRRTAGRFIGGGGSGDGSGRGTGVAQRTRTVDKRCVAGTNRGQGDVDGRVRVTGRGPWTRAGARHPRRAPARTGRKAIRSSRDRDR